MDLVEVILIEIGRSHVDKVYTKSFGVMHLGQWGHWSICQLSIRDIEMSKKLIYCCRTRRRTNGYTCNEQKNYFEALK